MEWRAASPPLSLGVFAEREKAGGATVAGLPSKGPSPVFGGVEAPTGHGDEKKHRARRADKKRDTRQSGRHTQKDVTRLKVSFFSQKRRRPEISSRGAIKTYMFDAFSLQFSVDEGSRANDARAAIDNGRVEGPGHPREKASHSRGLDLKEGKWKGRGRGEKRWM